MFKVLRGYKYLAFIYFVTNFKGIPTTFGYIYYAAMSDLRTFDSINSVRPLFYQIAGFISSFILASHNAVLL